MARFSEETFINWTKPASESEEKKLENAKRMVTQCIKSNSKLKDLNIEIFGQGSYANDTNVRLNSDIDINVCFSGGYYFDLPENTKREDFGLNGSIDYNVVDFKNDVEDALVLTFGRSNVIRNDKCITIKANSYRVETDVVPTWEYRRYKSDKSYYSGIFFKTDSGNTIKSYPKDHIENGILKNTQTSRRFKRLTRIFRKLRYRMLDDGLTINESITSFLLECLVWNVPNTVFNSTNNWTDKLKESIIYLYNNTKEDASCNEWGEVSELLYLFRDSRKWSRQDVNEYLLQLWRYLQF